MPPLFFWTTLGVAVGDLLASVHDSRSVWDLAASVPVTTLGLALAGVSPGWAFVASPLGLAAGIGAGIATLEMLDAYYLAELFAGVLVYYGVRLAVTRLIAGRGVS